MWSRATLAALVASGLPGCTESADEGGPAKKPAHAAHGEAGEGGEGGEGGEAGATAGLAEDTGFAVKLYQMAGHLTVAEALLRAGNADAGSPHLLHPIAEIYEPMAAAFKARGREGLAGAIEAVAERLAEGGEPAAVADATRANIELLSAEADKLRLAPAESARALAALIGVARAEYGAGVKDGAVVNTIEYQDAWGFIRFTQARLAAQRAAFDAMDADAAARVAAALDALAKMHATPEPEAGPPPAAADIRAAATEVELALHALAAK